MGRPNGDAQRWIEEGGDPAFMRPLSDQMLERLREFTSRRQMEYELPPIPIDRGAQAAEATAAHMERMLSIAGETAELTRQSLELAALGQRAREEAQAESAAARRSERRATVLSIVVAFASLGVAGASLVVSIVSAG